MIRELMMNAIEAAQHAPLDRRLIEISAQQVDGIPKLAIWNTGPGMDGVELQRVCNIASSLRKQKSLTSNFGMGAKVASLPSNQRGMRYRSCKNGVVHEVILCKRDGVYGLLRRYNETTNEYQEVADVTDLAKSDGRSCDEDWTEVVLHGNTAEQDTVKDPYNGDPEQDTQWLATYLYHRFYRLPDGVKVTLLKGTHKLDGNRPFHTIPSRLHFFERHEPVACANGIKVHYLYDAPYAGTGHNKSISGAIASAVSTCAVIYKTECMMFGEVKTGPSTHPSSASLSVLSTSLCTSNCRTTIRSFLMGIVSSCATLKVSSLTWRQPILPRSSESIARLGLLN